MSFLRVETSIIKKWDVMCRNSTIDDEFETLLVEKDATIDRRKYPNHTTLASGDRSLVYLLFLPHAVRFKFIIN